MTGISDSTSEGEEARLEKHRLDPDTRRKLVEAPGPSWREWFYHSFTKTYGLMGLFVADALVAAFWLEPPNPYGLAATVVPLLYLEFLLYQYLWYEPGVDYRHRSRSTRRHASEGRSWLRPFAFGRWSATGMRVRQGLELPPSATEQAPDPREFL